VGEATPRLEAWNKLDLLGEEEQAAVRAEAVRREDVVTLSALSGEGVGNLQAAVAARLTSGHQLYTIALDAADGAGAAWLHQHGEVLDQKVEGEKTVYKVRMSPPDFQRFGRTR
jgi:GTP-binding protein HflX